MKNEIQFHYYLDAWRWCRENNIPHDKIQRLNAKTWIISV